MHGCECGYPDVNVLCCAVVDGGVVVVVAKVTVTVPDIP